MNLESCKGSINAIKDEAIGEYKKAAELLVRMKRFVKETSVSDFGIDTSGDLSEAMQQAADAAALAGDNPLVNAIDKELNDQFGISTSSMLSIAQSVLKGSGSGLIKVIMAMLTFEGHALSFIEPAKKLHQAMTKIKDMIQAIPGGGNLQMSSRISIPPDIIVELNNIRNNLVRSMSYPFNTRVYVDNMNEVKDVCEALEKVKLLKVKNSVASTAAILVLNSMGVVAAPLGKILDRAKSVLLTDLETLLLTDLETTSKSTAKFNTAKKAVTRISQVLSQMTDTNVEQLFLIPKYIAALNVVYILLKTGRPAADVDPLAFDRSKIRLQVATVNSIMHSCRKLILFTLRPYKLSALQAELDRLNQLFLIFENEFALTKQAIAEISQAPGWLDKFEFVQKILDFLQDYSAALSLLASGDIDAFYDMTEITATAEGAAYIAILELAGICDQLFLTKWSSDLRIMANKFSRKSKEKQLKLESKKEKRTSKVTKKIEEINKLIEDTTELYSIISGIAITIDQLGGSR